MITKSDVIDSIKANVNLSLSYINYELLNPCIPNQKAII